MAERSEANSTIMKVADELRGKGKPFPTAIREIPNFPFDSFAGLMDAFRQRTVLLQRFSSHFDNNIFELFASRWERNLNTLYIALAFLLPLSFIALAFFYSWWWLAGLPSLLFALGRSKRLYNRVILSSAFVSELYFCFLYGTGQVCVTTADFDNSYYWKSS